MLGVNEVTAAGRLLEDVFAGPDLRPVVAQVQRTRRANASSTELAVQVRRGGAALSLVASATALRGPDNEYAGTVVVLDDLTELLKAQRVAAWREVAQRIAHEIKNPLTPIQLSAQRLRRRLARTPGEEQLVLEATETIIHEVDGLKRLVDEFSRFARMPVLAPRPTDVRQLVDSVASLYRESHPALSITTRHPDDLPMLEVDPDHIKRAVLNLVDNAVEAVGGTGEVQVETAHGPEAGHARIIVADNGPGISAEDKEKLFLPYFSTKVAGHGPRASDRARDRQRTRRHDLDRRQRPSRHPLRHRSPGLPRRRDGRGLRCPTHNRTSTRRTEPDYDARPNESRRTTEPESRRVTEPGPTHNRTYRARKRACA